MSVWEIVRCKILVETLKDEVFELKGDDCTCKDDELSKKQIDEEFKIVNERKWKLFVWLIDETECAQ